MGAWDNYSDDETLPGLST